MRKIILFLLFFIFSISCLKFEESDLDPNSPFSILLGLAQLQNNQIASELELRGTYLDNGELPGSFSFLSLQKINDDSWENMDLLNDNVDALDTDSNEYKAGTRIDFDGSFRFYIQEPGIYRWIYYQFLQMENEIVVQGSEVFRIDSIRSNPPISLRSAFTDPSHSFRWDRTEAVPFQQKRFDSITEEYSSFLGENNGYSYFISQCIQPQKYRISTESFNLRKNPCLHIRDPGENWHALILEDLDLVTISNPAGGDESTNIQSSRIIPTENNSVGFVLEITSSASATTYRSYKIDPTSRTILQAENVQPSGGTSIGIEIEKIRPFPGGMVYIETGSNEPRWDSNLLFAGSENQLISSGTNNFFELPGSLTSDNLSSHNGILLRQGPSDPDILRILNPDFTTTEISLSADDTPTNFVIRASKYSVTIFDTPGGGPFKIIPKSIALTSGTGSVNFLPGFDITSDSPPSFMGNQSNETQTVYGLETIQSGDAIKEIRSWNHTTGAFNSITLPNLSSIQPLESGFNFSENYEFGKQLLLDENNVTFIQKLSTSDGGGRSYQSNDFYFTTTSDDANWSEWNALPNWGM
ncbi:MAG: hypothetical protein JJT78_15760 [Leptospira sp.]|nr:hypothetical protein [Leptospira sp.]